MSLALFLEDLDKHIQGSPCHVNQMTFYVKRIGTKESQAEIKEIKEKLYGSFPKPGDVNENHVLANWLAYCGVVGWENVSNEEDDEEILYSRQEAIKLFTTKAYEMSLCVILWTFAGNYENYLADAAAEEIDQIKKP